MRSKLTSKMSNIQVVIPPPSRGGFGSPSGGGDQDPRRPGQGKPGREHEKAIVESPSRWAERAYLQNKRRRRKQEARERRES